MAMTLGSLFDGIGGWPDGYTDVSLNGKPASDANRYKALGNGMAQPCARFVIRRIAEVANGNE